MASVPDGGYALIYRSLLDHPAFSSEVEAWAFASLVVRAAWKPSRVSYCGFSMVVERGQLVISVRDFAQRWGWSKSKADRFFQRLEKENMIERKRDSTGTATGTATGTPANVITICNYDKFQAQAIERGTAPGQQEFPSGTQNKENKEAPSKDNNKLLSKGSPNRRHEWGGGEPPVEWVQWAMENMAWSRGSSVREANLFIDNAKAHRRLYVDWFAAWRNWCRSPFQKTTSQQQALTL